MGEPKYDEDFVNLGYLLKQLANTEEDISSQYKDVSRNYGSKPNPPYYKGDTWIDGNVIYTCISTRLVGLYNDEDWTTESGAKEEAERKNKIYLTQPSNYNAGDMWILQTDNDHKAGKKGEILITTVGRAEYDEGDWVNMLGYGTISSINEVAGNLNNAINRIGNVEEAIEDGIIITFYQNTVPEGKHIGDLWYVTETVDNYIEGKLYRYDGEKWMLLDDPSIEEAFARANEARLVADGKIQSFYSETEPTENMGVGDLWIDTANNNQLYRYNGTNWVAVYDTRVNQLVTDVETITERTVEISTDLGYIQQTVSETTTRINDLETVQKGTVKSVEVQYALSNSSVIAPTTGWSTTAPEWQSNKYMWQKTVTTYSDGTVVETSATCIQGAKGENGADGKDGINGQDGLNGKDGADGKSAYQIWLDAGNTGTETEYLESLKGIDGKDGEQGLQGEKGDTGIGIANIQEQYYLSTSNITQEGGEWSETQDTWVEGTYIWTRSKVDWTDGTTTYTTPVLANALNGANEDIVAVKQSIAEQVIEVDKITQSVTETTTKLNELETEQSTMKTQYEQSKSEFNFKFSEITETTGNNTSAIEDFLKYIRFVDGNIILGEAGNEYELKIENDQINIYYNGFNLSSWVRDQFKATDAEFTNSLKLGNFAFLPRSNGNLSFKKISS